MIEEARLKKLEDEQLAKEEFARLIIEEEKLEIPNREKEELEKARIALEKATPTQSKKK